MSLICRTRLLAFRQLEGALQRGFRGGMIGLPLEYFLKLPGRLGVTMLLGQGDSVVETGFHKIRFRPDGGPIARHCFLMPALRRQTAEDKNADGAWWLHRIQRQGLGRARQRRRKKRQPNFWFLTNNACPSRRFSKKAKSDSLNQPDASRLQLLSAA